MIVNQSRVITQRTTLDCEKKSLVRNCENLKNANKITLKWEFSSKFHSTEVASLLNRSTVIETPKMLKRKEFPRPDISESLKAWKLAQPSRPLGSGNACSKKDFSDILYDLCTWNPCEFITIYNSNRDCCGEIGQDGEGIAYWVVNPGLQDQWEHDPEEFQPHNVAFLHANGVWYEEEIKIENEFCPFPNHNPTKLEQTVHKFVEKLIKAWKEAGWLDAWKGLYLVLNDGGCVDRTNGVSQIMTGGATLKTRIGCHTLMLETQSHAVQGSIDLTTSPSQFFLEFK